jgi:hypothetical protein
MQIDLNDSDNSYDANSPLATGGLATGGSFGEDALAAPSTTMLYLRQINPNLVVGGALLLGAIALLSLLVAGLGKANPNNQMLQAQTATAQANSTALTATTDALKTVANQRPSCIAIVCNFPDAQSAQAAQPPVEPHPDYDQASTGSGFNNQLSPTAASQPAQPITAAVPNDPTLPDWWRQQWQTDPNYVQQWINFCPAVRWESDECRAISQAF